MHFKVFKLPTRSNNTVVPLVQQPKAIYLPNLVSPDKVFFLRIIYLLDVHNKIQVGMELTKADPGGRGNCPPPPPSFLNKRVLLLI